MVVLAPKIIKEFCDLCDKAHSAWQFHRNLFEINPVRDDLQKSPANDALTRVSELSQEYVLHQIAKLHDPAVQNNQINLGINYIVEYGGWNKSTRQRLLRLQKKLGSLSDKIRPARNKLLSHNDLATILSGATLGAFEENDAESYFQSLQDFVNIIHEEVVGGSRPLDDFGLNDAYALIGQLSR